MIISSFYCEYYGLRGGGGYYPKLGIVTQGHKALLSPPFFFKNPNKCANSANKILFKIIRRKKIVQGFYMYKFSRLHTTFMYQFEMEFSEIGIITIEKQGVYTFT